MILKELKLHIATLTLLGAFLLEVTTFQFTDYSKSKDLRGLVSNKEKMALLKPEFRVKLLRYIENDDNDSLAYLKKQMNKFESDQKLVNEMKSEMIEIGNLIKNKDFKKALDWIITVKGQVKEINMLDTKEITKQIDSLRLEMYKEAGKN